MILTPGNVFYVFGLFLIVVGNLVGIVFGLLCIIAAAYLWNCEDEGLMDYDKDDCPCGQVCCRACCDVPNVCYPSSGIDLTK